MIFTRNYYKNWYSNFEKMLSLNTPVVECATERGAAGSGEAIIGILSERQAGAATADVNSRQMRQRSVPLGNRRLAPTLRRRRGS